MDPYIGEAAAHNHSAQVIQVEQGKSLSVVALVLAAGSLVGLVILALMVSNLIDAKAHDAASVAIVRAGQAQQDVALARRDIQTLQVELKKHGIDIPAN